MQLTANVIAGRIDARTAAPECRSLPCDTDADDSASFIEEELESDEA